MGAMLRGPAWAPALAFCLLLPSSSQAQPLELWLAVGSNTEDDLGQGLAAGVDLSGDGIPDIVAGAPGYDGLAGSNSGRVQVFSGADGSPVDAVDGPVAESDFGWDIDFGGDVDGDAVADFIVGAPRVNGDEGRAYVYSGATRVLLATLSGAGGRFGEAVAGIGDVDADGVSDWLVGAPREGASFDGAARLFSGATGNPIDTISGASANDRFGSAVDGIADVDGDAVADLLVGAPGLEPLPASGITAAGGVYVLSGATRAEIAVHRATDQTFEWGAAVASVPDADGDALEDFLIGAPADSPAGFSAGWAVLMSSAGGALRVWDVGESRESLGNAVASAGDVDGDGTPDFLIAGSRWSPYVDGFEEFNTGRVRAFSGAAGAVMGEVRGEGQGGYFGTRARSVGDLNGDGLPEIVVGDPRRYTGRVIVYDLRGGCEDRDGDGFAGPCDLDCDETNAAVNPGATEIPGNGVDEDCDGTDLPARQPQIRFAFDGEQAGDTLGTLFGLVAMSGVGDVNGDAVGDLLIGAPAHDGPAGADSGRLYVRSGANGALIQALNGAFVQGYFGIVAGGDDVNGDSVADFLVSAPGVSSGSGRLYAYSGASRSVLDTVDGTGGFFGLALLGTPDANLDGIGDWAVGAPYAGYYSQGEAFVYSGADLSVLASGIGGQPNGGYGFTLATVPDVNGDGIVDGVVGSPNYPFFYMSLQEPDAGAVDVISGLGTGRIYFQSGRSSYLYMGTAVAGLEDVNEDGGGDVAVGVPRDFFQTPTGSINAGRVYLLTGPTGDRERAFEGVQDDERFGTAIANVGDYNGDGFEEILVGAPYWDGPLGPDTGRVALINPRNGYVIREIFGEAPGDGFGSAIVTVDDLTGDGHPEVLIAAPGRDGPGGEDVGRVYLYDLHFRPTECIDADGDGYSVRAGVAPIHSPWYDALCGYVDCNDADAAVHPFALEIPGDGVDQNCNGSFLCGALPEDEAGRPWVYAPPFAAIVLALVAWRRRVK